MNPISEPRVFCIIPARGGSKRLPNKNLLEFQGETLVSRATRLADSCGIFDQIILSSDSQEILDAVDNSLKVQKILRNPKFATDEVRAEEVIRNLISSLKISSEDIICCLLPTTPLLSVDDLQKAYSKLLLCGLGVIFGVTRSVETPFRTFLMNENHILNPLFKSELDHQSHTYPDTYTDAGQFYFATASIWLDNYSITNSDSSTGFLLDSNKCIDINTPEDWKRFLINNA